MSRVALLALLQDVSSMSAPSSAFVTGFVFICGVLMVFMIASVWMVHVKAGEPGWSCLVPFYNLWVWIRMARKPGLWFLWSLIPFVNIVIAIMLNNAVARNFGKSTAFGWGITLLGFIFIPILAWGDAEFNPVAG
jgi:Family of unknown function (DUF5684)